MKRLMIFCLLLCLSAGAAAQADSVRSFHLRAVDKRGRPVRNAELMYQLARQKNFVLMNPRGVAQIDSVTHADTLILYTRGFLGELPMAGLDSVALLVKRSRIDIPQPEMQNIGYQTIPASSNSSPVSSLKVGKDISTLGYSDLASYINGRIAGV
ncbi:MAG: hypothetical protein LBU95_04405 [Rikenellaceae bacterium]|jgi:hypothetical protein|nr:hypothetical protein [Rikenellaceae bacterium]